MDDKWLTTGQMLDRLLEDEVAENEKGQQVYLDKRGALTWVNSTLDILVNMTSEVLMNKWHILPKYISFEEAMKALKNGKTVLYYPEGQDEPVEVEAYLWISNLGTRATWEDLIEGKWTIQEGQAS